MKALSDAEEAFSLRSQDRLQRSPQSRTLTLRDKTQVSCVGTVSRMDGQEARVAMIIVSPQDSRRTGLHESTHIFTIRLGGEKP